MIDGVDTQQLREPIDSIRKNLKHKFDSLGHLNKASASVREYVVKAQSAAALKSSRQRSSRNINEMSRVLQSRLRLVHSESRGRTHAQRSTNPEVNQDRFVALVNRLRDSNQQESLRELLRQAEMVETQLTSDDSETAVVSPVNSSPVSSLLDSVKLRKNSSISSSLETLANNETEDQNKPDPFFLPRENDIELDRSIIFHRAFRQRITVSMLDSRKPEKELSSQPSSRKKQVPSVQVDGLVSKVSTSDLDEGQSDKLSTISSFIKRSNDKEIGCSTSSPKKSKDSSQNVVASSSDSEEPVEKSSSSRRKQVFSVRVDDSAKEVSTHDFDKKHGSKLPSFPGFRKRSYPASRPSTVSRHGERRVELNQLPLLWQMATAGTAFAYKHKSEVAETSSVQRLHTDAKKATSGIPMSQPESISSQSRKVVTTGSVWIPTTGSAYQFPKQKQASKTNRPEVFTPDENENKIAVIKSKSDEVRSREMPSRSPRATSSRADFESNSPEPSRLQSEQEKLSNLDVSEMQANVNAEDIKKLEGTFFKHI
ncbi:hypothetical protein EB796_020031 [Bugula neritina]|uniref:Uncharacterized protein n=1 Tax=Bugula neritina TaxID=10212 RepID=A0A7J7J7C3_BUGNE|nr:hypothetical protein EB796_020031 [Bugula neritina]